MEIEDLTAEALEQYPLEGTEQRIPLLEEVLPLFTDRAPLIVELKAERGNAEALAAAASRVLKKGLASCLSIKWVMRPMIRPIAPAHRQSNSVPPNTRQKPRPTSTLPR